MRVVPYQAPWPHRVGVQVDAVGALLDGKDRHRLRLVSRRALPGDEAVFPGVPGAHDELTPDLALAQRAAAVVAAIADGPELPLVEEHRDLLPVKLERQGRPGGELLTGTEAVPGGHGVGPEGGNTTEGLP
jgi:hypothetical protein